MPVLNIPLNDTFNCFQCKPCDAIFVKHFNRFFRVLCFGQTVSCGFQFEMDTEVYREEKRPKPKMTETDAWAYIYNAIAYYTVMKQVNENCSQQANVW